MDKYRIDDHKLMYHIPRVHDWLLGKKTYPIYMEISPSGACNHRCRFCALDYMGYKNRFLETGRMLELLPELDRLGLKSLMFGGEGEPLLHRAIGALTKKARESGIDVSFTTNGVLLRNDIVSEILPFIEWIKVSCNAGSSETYAEIHRTKPADFDKVMANLSSAVKFKKDHELSCTIGMQLLLLPENSHEVVKLAGLARDIGLDYLVVKPYSQHLSSKTKDYEDIRYEQYLGLNNELAVFNTDRFQVVFRTATMEKWDAGGDKNCRCLALPFWSYLDSSGNVWGCSAYLGDQRFLYGNIYKNSFQDIWEGETRAESLRWVETELDACQCRINCRMDKINDYLWQLKNPPDHINFI